MSNSGEWSAPDRFSDNEVELVDEIVLSEDILDEDGSVIGELDDRQLASALREELDGVELALERLDAGSYGLCDSCGNPIDDAVLAEMPQARACSAHLV